MSMQIEISTYTYNSCSCFNIVSYHQFHLFFISCFSHFFMFWNSSFENMNVTCHLFLPPLGELELKIEPEESGEYENWPNYHADTAIRCHLHVVVFCFICIRAYRVWKTCTHIPESHVLAQ